MNEPSASATLKAGRRGTPTSEIWS